MKKRVLSVMLAIAFILSVCPMGSLFTASALPPSYRDMFHLDKTDTTLTISGEGSIDEYTFESDHFINGVENIVIAAGIREISSTVFLKFTKLKTITVDQNSPYYFSNGSCLVEKATKKIIKICENGTIPTESSVNTIGEYAFSGLTELTNITIPNNITKIEQYAFLNCSNLETVTIPAGVVSIGNEAFDGCSLNLTVYGTVKTPAHTYAKANSIRFVDKNHICSNIGIKIVRATFTKNGYYEEYCKECNEGMLGYPIMKVSSVKLSATSYTYNGKTKTPTVVVKNADGGLLKQNTDYTLTYSKGRKEVGKCSVKITLKGNYSGTKTVYFTVNPKGTSVKKVYAGKKSATVKWSKQTTKTSGYQIQYATSSKFSKSKTVTVNSNKTTSKTIKKLTGGKKYYVRIRTYKTVGKTKYYSDWSSKKSVKVKSK